MTLEPIDPTKDKHAPEEKGKGSSNNRRASAAALIDAFAQQYQADREETGRREKHRIFREWLTIIGLFIAAIVAFFQWRELRSTDHNIAEQAKIGAGQLKAMQDQLIEMRGTGEQTDTLIETNKRLAEAANRSAEVAEKTLKTTQRAYFGIAHSLSSFALNERPSVSIKFKNVGATPAYKMHHLQFIDIAKFPLDRDLTIRIIPSNRLTSLSKDETIQSDNRLNGPLSEPLYSEINEGKSYRLIVWGELRYEDAFQAPHFYRYCFLYDGDKARRSSPDLCEQHNDSD